MGVRYAIVALIFAALVIFVVGGYVHARRRVRQGMTPLPYHRWMVQRRYYDAGPRYQTYQAPGHTYVMDAYPPPPQAPPPPAYNPADAPPPVYQPQPPPPPGGSKAMADQSYAPLHPPAPDETGIASPGPAAAAPLRS